MCATGLVPGPPSSCSVLGSICSPVLGRRGVGYGWVCLPQQVPVGGGRRPLVSLWLCWLPVLLVAQSQGWSLRSSIIYPPPPMLRGQLCLLGPRQVHTLSIFLGETSVHACFSGHFCGLCSLSALCTPSCVATGAAEFLFLTLLRPQEHGMGWRAAPIFFPVSLTLFTMIHFFPLLQVTPPNLSSSEILG